MTSHGCGASRMRFQGAKQRPSKGQDLNALVNNAVSEVLKQNKHTKAKVNHNSGLEDDLDNFTLEKLNIRE